VITQADPKYWKEKFGYDCIGRNDSELILRAIEAGKEPLEEFPNSSIAAVQLKKNGELKFYRNGARPLWYTYHGDSLFVASTRDILRRAFQRVGMVSPIINECTAGMTYYFDYAHQTINCETKQYQLDCSKYYLQLP